MLILILLCTASISRGRRNYMLSIIEYKKTPNPKYLVKYL